MKKNYLSILLAALMLLVAMPATAQESSIEDLFGTYKFTATITSTPEGQSYTDLWKSECEVIITKEGSYNVVKGLLGSPKSQLITDIDDEKFWVNNPNPTDYGLWDNHIGVSDLTLENLQLYTMEYYYNSTTKEITIPEFSICQFTFPEGVMTATELAKVTNAKMILIEGEDNSSTSDLSGNWHFVAGDEEYDTMIDSELPTEWGMALAATDESNAAYNVSLKLGDFAPLTLSATFEGSTLLIAYDNAYLDADKKIALADANSGAFTSEIEFSLNNENELSLTYGFAIMQAEPIDCKQFYYAGTATCATEAFTWVGTYTVTAEVEVLDNTYEYPETGEMEVAYDEDYNEYYVAKLFGEDLTGLWYYGNGIVIVPSAEQANKATINTIGAYGESIYLRQIESGLLLKMVDADGGTNPLNLEINEDGTISMDNFKVMVEDNTKGSPVTPAAIYKNITIAKKGNEPGTGEDEGEEEDNAVESVIVENKAVMGIFDLLGRKLDAITGPGLYIVNGKKVVIK